MQIVVRNRRGKPLRESLTMFVVEGKAYATWKPKPPLRLTNCLNVSDDLANMVLGNIRSLCHHAGQEPMLRSFWTDECYTVREGGSDGEYYAYTHCSSCGYRSNTVSGGAFLNQGRLGAIVHPPVQALITQECADFEQAEWNEETQTLIPAGSALVGELTLTLHSWWDSRVASFTLRPIADTEN